MSNEEPVMKMAIRASSYPFPLVRLNIKKGIRGLQYS